MLAARTEHVGSLLRPRSLLDARDAHAEGRLTDGELKQAEDEAVREVLAMQEEAGLDVVNDGEQRRESFQSELTASVDGFSGVSIDAWLWGSWHSDELGDKEVRRPTQVAVVEPLRQRRSLAAEEFTFLRALTTRAKKVTLPSPSLFANLWDPERSKDAYPTFDLFIEAVTDLMCREVQELARLGCTYVQLDAPHYPLLVDPDWRAFYEERGWTADSWIAYGLERDNAVIAAAPGITFGFHLCKGNQDSRWLVAGGYDDIARPVFRGVDADRLLLEYDDERSGGFEPLAEVPDDKVVVLGLVTTKTPRLEAAGELEARVHAAARYTGLDRLAVSPQCGFSTSVVGNALSMEDQRRKLRLVCEVADRVWG